MKVFTYYQAHLTTAPGRHHLQGAVQRRVREAAGCRPGPQAAPQPRAARMWPPTNWKQVRSNLSSKVLPQHTRDAWFECVHDIVPTPALLHAR